MILRVAKIVQMKRQSRESSKLNLVLNMMFGFCISSPKQIASCTRVQEDGWFGRTLKSNVDADGGGDDDAARCVYSAFRKFSH